MHGRIEHRFFCAVRTVALVTACLCVLSAAAPAETRWVDQVQWEPFRCRADFPLVDCQALLKELRLLQNDIATQLQLEPGDDEEAIELFLFRDQQTYRRYLHENFPGVPMRRALFIKHRGPGMVFAYRSAAMATDLRHEATHALLHGRFHRLPFWLDEGLAEYFETPRDQRRTGSPHLRFVRHRCRADQVPRLDRLEAIRHIQQMNADAYRDSWAWVHFMLHGPPAANRALLQYLADLRSRGPIEPLDRRLHRSVPHLERRFVQHFTTSFD